MAAPNRAGSVLRSPMLSPGRGEAPFDISVRTPLALAGAVEKSHAHRRGPRQRGAAPPAGVATKDGDNGGFVLAQGAQKIIVRRALGGALDVFALERQPYAVAVGSPKSMGRLNGGT